jgi:hypothetical protein
MVEHEARRRPRRSRSSSLALVFAVAFAVPVACKPHRTTPSSADASAASVSPPASALADDSVGDSSAGDASPGDASLADASPYDLAADLSRRTDEARALFPRSAYPALATRVEGTVYLLVAPQGPAMVSAGAHELRRALRYYYERPSTPGDASSPPPFARRPDHAVSVYLFATRAAFPDFARHEGVDPDHPVVLYGFALPEQHELVISGQEGLGTLQHETVHTMVPDADFPGIPRWMDEGLASLVEQARFDPDGSMHAQSNGRYLVLQHALRADAGPARPSLAALFAMSNHEFLGGSPLTPEGKRDLDAKTAAELLHYGTARSFCQWAFAEHHALWAFYHAWRDGFDRDPTGEKAFAAVMGGSFAALEADWEAWVMAQRW